MGQTPRDARPLILIGGTIERHLNQLLKLKMNLCVTTTLNCPQEPVPLIYVFFKMKLL